MKINKGNNLVFSSHQTISWWSNIDSFYNNFTEPDEIYINGIIQTEIKNKYYFSETTNTVILIYKHPITDCAAMFWTCNEIVEMDLSHFDTSHVTRMLGMFCDCYKLASLDLSNLNTSKITDMAYMFEDCRQMTSLNLSMFTTSFVINMVRMFAGCSKLRYINLENAEIKVTKLISTDIFADTPRNLILCSKYNEWNSFFNENILYLNCNFDYDIINEIKCYTKNISIPFNLCQTCGNNYLQLYNSNDQYHSNEYINCTKQISCYFSCKTCEKEGNITYHNCLECNDNYNYILNISNTKNCYNNCLNYFYYNEKINISFCTENNECPKEYDKLIPDIRKCISNCSNDEYYKYEFNNRCYNICPSNSIERINTKILNGISYGKYFCKPKFIYSELLHLKNIL